MMQTLQEKNEALVRENQQLKEQHLGHAPDPPRQDSVDSGTLSPGNLKTDSAVAPT